MPLDAVIAAGRFQRKLKALHPLPEKAIRMARNIIEAEIPLHWRVYRAGLRMKIEKAVNITSASYSQDSLFMTQAVTDGILKWARKIFPATGASPPKDAGEYITRNIHRAGPAGAFPRRIEAMGGPNYPGAKAPGAAKGAVETAREAAGRQFNTEAQRIIRSPL